MLSMGFPQTGQAGFAYAANKARKVESHSEMLNA
jgi:hypothetical protein